MFAKITGIGSYLPKRRLSNDDLEKMVDTTAEWIVSRSGIRNRHIASQEETAATMGTFAAQKALTAANVSAEQVGLVIVATATPDRIFPSTACTIQKNLQLVNAAAFDVSAACSGFIYALSIADQYIRTEKYQHVLVIGTEVLSKVVDWTDRTTCVLFGDGAGAVLLSASQTVGILDTHLEAMGQYGDILYLPNAGLELDAEPKKLCMQGKEVFKLAVNLFSDLITNTIQKNHIQQSDIDWLIPHQANIRIIESLAKRLSLSMDHVVVTLAEQGNTSAASIPLALDAAVQDGRIQPGQLLLLAAFGGGITWGSALIRL